jgi:cation transporter-like permease
MALTNIFREPRREITETMVGLAAVTALCIAGLKFRQFAFPDLRENLVGCAIAGIIMIIVLSVIAMGLIVALHSVGDAICKKGQIIGIRILTRIHLWAQRKLIQHD